jgi:hypothetical protein
MDEVTQIGDEKMLGRVATEWREVCRWDVEETETRVIEVKRWDVDPCEGCSWPDATLVWRQLAESYTVAFDSALAAFEELAGEKSKGEAEWEAINAEESKILADMRERSPAPESCPGPDHYYSKGGWKHKPRRSKLAAIEPDHPTVQADPPAGEIGPLQGQGEARNADGTPIHCR